MADTKISDLTAATSIGATDLLPIVQSATTKKTTVSLLLGTTVKVTGSDFTNATTSLVNITGLTFAASASTKYEVDALLAFQCSDTAGANFCVAYSAAGATGTWVGLGGGSASLAVTNSRALGSSGTNNFNTIANTTQTVWIKAVVIVGANTGNITIQGSKTSTGTLTVYTGSRMTVTLL